MAHLFDELHPPAGRRANLESIARYWEHHDKARKQAERDVQAARKAAEKMPDDHEFARQLARAEDNLLGVRGDAKMARRRIVEDVARGREPWTVEAPLTAEQAIDAEERRARLMQDTAHAHGLPTASPVERELRETKRELQRLRAQLGGS